MGLEVSDRINIGELNCNKDKDTIEAYITIDDKYVGSFVDMRSSGEMYFEFLQDDYENLFYELTTNYKGLKELQQETLISDLIRRKYNM